MAVFSVQFLIDVAAEFLGACRGSSGKSDRVAVVISSGVMSSSNKPLVNILLINTC
jgi:hypothetical protein